MGSKRHKGKVRWYDLKRGYGFIDTDDGQSVFCHYSVIHGQGYRSLESGDIVEFNIEEGSKGLIAHSVKRVSTGFSHLQRKR